MSFNTFPDDHGTLYAIFNLFCFKREKQTKKEIYFKIYIVLKYTSS